MKLKRSGPPSILGGEVFQAAQVISAAIGAFDFFAPFDFRHGDRRRSLAALNGRSGRFAGSGSQTNIGSGFQAAPGLKADTAQTVIDGNRIQGKSEIQTREAKGSFLGPALANSPFLIGTRLSGEAVLRTLAMHYGNSLMIGSLIILLFYYDRLAAPVHGIKASFCPGKTSNPGVSPNYIVPARKPHLAWGGGASQPVRIRGQRVRRAVLASGTPKQVK